MSNTIKCESCGNYIDEHMKDNCPSCNKTDKSKENKMTDKLIICKDCGIEYDFDFHKGCPACKSTQTNITIKNEEHQSVNNGGHQKVKVIDFDMEFGSMVWFMIKWALASIPAFIILFILLTLLVSIFGVSMVSLFTI